MINFKKRYDKFTGESMYCGTHESGVRVCIMPKPGYSKKYAMFATKYGSCDTEFDMDGKRVKIPDGTAHFLEHKLFDMPDGSDAFLNFSKFGANANAFTSFSVTAYHFSATRNFKESLKNLIEFVQTPYFTAKSVAKEQGIIAQEIKMYDDDPHWRVFFNCLEAMYVNNSVKIDIAGTTETIATIDEQVLYDIYSVFYHPSNMVLFIAGDVDPEEIGEFADKTLKSVSEACRIERKYPDEPDEIGTHYTEQRLDVAVPLFAIGFKDNSANTDSDTMIKKEIEMQILCHMLFSKCSDIYKKLYEQGLINESFSADYSISQQYAYTLVEGESKKPKEVYEAIMDGLCGKELDIEDFKTARAAVWGGYIRMFNSAEAVSYNFAIGILNGMDYFGYKDIFERVTFEDVCERFKKHFTKENSALSVVWPAN